MNYRLPFQFQIFLGLVTGLLLGLLFQNIPTIGPDSTSEIPTPFPPQSQYIYENLDAAWKVNVIVFPDKPPIIISVEKIENTRLSHLQSGENEISLLDDADKKIFTQTFKVSFLITGLEKKYDQRQLIFILPFMESSKKIIIATPEGTSEYELP